ncbi:MAG: 2-dehydro-3-deoxy-L-rhamnonate dehydrogenase (NAD(+)) [Paracidovorax wautersii]|uniref:2-dehydro-3-deoxy-L-rhamnonate dehydrogenase (NAD(+)) n=1 Tax=Paracidovorax wautersii TaxID=1177982 RepID=A0A7V8FQL7_9BURK|nr:MAG: 2-dehydro-3-deoxy-L-rhamnonate dehydrogenase (NAD(+)) [Paracidovorax wautersii]
MTRTAVIAGACGGIGRAVAQRLAADGLRLALWDIDATGLAEMATSLRAGGTEVLTCAADLTREACVARALQETTQAWPAVDVLVHGAGVTGPCLPVVGYPLDAWQRTLDINLTSAFLCARAAVPLVRQSEHGRIVFLSSIAGKEGNAEMAAYSAAKAGVIALTKSLGKELAHTPARVNCIAPAVIETALVRQMTPEALAASLSRIPVGRMGRPAEVAALVAWLASAECSFSTGAVFDLSGGRATY